MTNQFKIIIEVISQLFISINKESSRDRLLSGTPTITFQLLQILILFLRTLIPSP